MSANDFSSGLGAGYSRANAVQRDAENTVNRWQEFSGKLESKLLNEQVERSVAIDYVKALRAALKQVSPAHPLLVETEAEKFLDAARTKAFAEKGFYFDKATNNIVSKR